VQRTPSPDLTSNMEQPMGEAGDDDTTVQATGSPEAVRTILFLPGATPAVVVAGAQRSEGWVGECPATEADDLERRRLAVVFPDDWPALSPPAVDGEPLPIYIERAVFGHGTVIALMRPGASVKLKLPIISSIRPGELTVDWWIREYPSDRRFFWIDDHPRHTILFYFLNYLIWRLLVQLFDELRTGAWVMHGVRKGDLEPPLQPIPLGAWRNADMLLDLQVGSFGFDPQRVKQAPTGLLPSFSNLVLYPSTAAPASVSPNQKVIPQIPGELSSQSGTSAPVRGYWATDAPLLEEMRRLLTTGEAPSIWKAAEAVSLSAKGSNFGDSRTKRLVQKYKQKNKP
jgi:hypothetical protein